MSYEVDPPQLQAVSGQALRLGEALGQVGRRLPGLVDSLNLYSEDPNLPPVGNRAQVAAYGLRYTGAQMREAGLRMGSVAADVAAADTFGLVETDGFDPGDNPIDRSGGDPADRVPANIAAANATGDWTDVDGGDPALYNAEQVDVVLRAMGFDDTINDDVARELFAAINDPALLSMLWQEGRAYEAAWSREYATPTDLVLPVGGSVGIEASVAHSLTDEQIGVGFTQTHELEVTARVIAAAEARAGKSTLNRLYSRINQLSRWTQTELIPGPIRDLIRKNPLLEKALKGVMPFSVAYRQYVGTEVGYEATLTAAQVDAGITPNLFDPSTLEPGNSIVVRASTVAGTGTELTYKRMDVGGQIETFNGVGYGVEALGDQRVAIYAGDIDAIKNKTTWGLPFAKIGGSTAQTSFDLLYAEIDLNTAAGRNAYRDLVFRGIIPDSSGEGVVTGTSTAYSSEYELSLGVNVGFLAITESLGRDSFTYKTTSLDDGRTVTTIEGTWANKASEIVVPHGPGGQIDLDRAVVSVAVSNLGANDLALTGLAFDDPTLAPTTRHPDGNAFVAQVTFTAPELFELRDVARAAVQHRSRSEGEYHARLHSPADFTESLAAAETMDALLRIIIGRSPFEQDELLAGLAITAQDADPSGQRSDFVPLPGTVLIGHG